MRGHQMHAAEDESAEEKEREETKERESAGERGVAPAGEASRRKLTFFQRARKDWSHPERCAW